MTEREELQDLLSSAGWGRVVGYAKASWGPAAYARQLEQAVTEALAKDGNPSATIMALKRAQNEINAVLNWPSERLKDMERQSAAEAHAADHSRRGPL